LLLTLIPVGKRFTPESQAADRKLHAKNVMKFSGVKLLYYL